ncbi:MAG TPA: tetraacyldisaccharide 4'-kinase [Puia sp.]|nr:tetraacyldisaccharide 4'-kinase [Puia sp.]
MLLLPVSILYGLVIHLRNWMFDKKIIGSTSFNLPLICVGNLSVGGTGKSPMVEFLVKRLKAHVEIAVLSRGYKRKTRGYALADSHTTALDIGDEPMQFHLKFPDITIAVGEERVVAIPQLLHDRPATRAIVLDDAFQHRSVRAGLNILLTDYNNLFTRDWFLPTGDLRDEKKSYKRADIIVVTKCERNLRESEKHEIIGEISPLPTQQVFFSSIEYGDPYHIISKIARPITGFVEVLLVCGIANPAPIKKFLDTHSKTYYELTYRDHHIFSIDDLKNIIRRFNQLPAKNKIILTTEKDAVRLVKFEQELRNLPFYVIPIESRFLFNEEHRFTDLIVTFINGFNHLS